MWRRGVFPRLRVNALYKSVEFPVLDPGSRTKKKTNEKRNGLQKKVHTGNNANYHIIISMEMEKRDWGIVGVFKGFQRIAKIC